MFPPTKNLVQADVARQVLWLLARYHAESLYEHCGWRQPLDALVRNEALSFSSSARKQIV